MKIIRGLRNLSSPPNKAVVTLGNFDGAHIGHQDIFRRTVDRAKETGGTPVMYTFDPHPLKILAPEQNINLLTTFKQKMELIASCGIEVAICADFTRDFARMHPRDFATMLYDSLKMVRVVVGHDYSFGRGGTGSIEYLKKMGDELRFDVEVVPPVMVDGERVSSTRVRNLLYEGKLIKANRMLGRYYCIAGKVVSGYQRGAAIGFPTANLDTPYEVIPMVGVYAVIARVDADQWYDGVVNIGYNPTFDRDDFIVEAHLLGHDHDEKFYGAEVELYFVDRLREEKKFEDVKALKRGIAEDIKRARIILDEIKSNSPLDDPRESVR